MDRKSYLGQDLACPSCGSHHIVKCGWVGRSMGDCGKHFLCDTSNHKYEGYF
ncbi:hypothetical protein [Sulfurisphaera tokodaii]|uniref:Uncharacterized protein n=1 Tax=Sulfurisphaera tokodaii TaxID=111955 RepID=A0A832TM93_9CREN|nr:hypothetical protein [Sulfurisphaera tokodaii]